MSKKILKSPLRTTLIIVISLLLIKNISIAALLFDGSAIIDLFVHSLLLFIIIKNYRYTRFLIWVWATLYLFVYTGIKAGAKSLIILRGDSWEINMSRYYIDLFLVVFGLVLLIFEDKLYKEESPKKTEET